MMQHWKIGVLSLFAGLTAVACGGASGVNVSSKSDPSNPDTKQMIISWDGAGAGLYVTDEVAVTPTGYDEAVKGGTTYWAIEATAWPGGFDSPITYGHLPDGAKDVTAKNNGTSGGAPLVKGTAYKISIIGFGGSPTVQRMTWE